jgi:hypothetical protein
MKRPLSLTVTAWVFIIAGLLCAWDMIEEFGRSRFSLHAGIALSPIGVGLLKLRPMARKFALLCIVLGWGLLGYAVVIALLGGELHVAGVIITGWRRDVALVGICNALGVILAWVTWVLLRRETRTLFQTNVT